MILTFNPIKLVRHTTLHHAKSRHVTPRHAALHRRQRVSESCDRPGDNSVRFERVAQEVSKWTPKQRRVCLKFDEINTLGELVWERNGGEYECWGLRFDTPT